jgi:hypothetical protein
VFILPAVYFYVRNDVADFDYILVREFDFSSYESTSAHLLYIKLRLTMTEILTNSDSHKARNVIFNFYFKIFFDIVYM